MFLRATALSLLITFGTCPLIAATNKACPSGRDKTLAKVHGRLGVYNGGYPNLRLWHVGTHHLFGIYGGPADLQCQHAGTCGSDQDGPDLPTNVDKKMTTLKPIFEYWLYGDYVLLELESYKSGHMQAACIVSATHLIRRKS